MTEQGNMSDLWKRLRFVFIAILVYRMGTHIPIPGIDPVQLERFFSSQDDTLIGLFNLFSGGALERMSVFALNVVPYISSAIIMQLFFKFNTLSSRIKKRRTGWKE
jgi:preprotein translocase subunit SecY